MPERLARRRRNAGIVALAVVLAAIALGIAWRRDAHREEAVSEPASSVAGTVQFRTLHPDGPAKGTVVFLADANDPLGSREYPELFAAQGYDVLVVDAQGLLSAGDNAAPSCIDIAARLSNIPAGLAADAAPGRPILVGDGLGAALAYIAAAQAPAHRFHAVVSINFAPPLDVPLPVCDAERLVATGADGRIALAPVGDLPTSWYVFQDVEAGPELAGPDFTDAIGNARFTLRSSGQAPVVSGVVQILQWLDPRLADQTASDVRLGGLPLIEVPAQPGTSSRLLAVLLTGDGGWAELDKGVAAGLATRGVPTVALDSLSYFWKRRTAEDAARDLDAVIAEYRSRWGKDQVVLIGYSFGADALPVIANRLDASSKRAIVLIALLGLGDSAALEFHLSSWLDADDSPDRIPLLPEMRQLSWTRVLCVYGEADREAHCESFDGLGMTMIRMPGDHHFDARYGQLAQYILENAAAARDTPASPRATR